MDYQFIATSAAGFHYERRAQALSSLFTPLPLRRFSRTLPLLTNAHGYAGGTVTFNATFTACDSHHEHLAGEDTNSAFVNITGATNATLTLSNIQLSAAGTYQFAATNLIGRSNSTPGTLIVIPGPTLATNPYPHAVITNSGLFAYWRLNETNNPATSPFPVQAYDYSGNGHYPVYTSTVTVGNQPRCRPASPGAPGYIGFETNATAAGTGFRRFSNVPALNLATNTVTFICLDQPQSGSRRQHRTIILAARQ